MTSLSYYMISQLLHDLSVITCSLSYYSECSLERKAQSNLYLLKLSVQDKHTAYNKDDVWYGELGHF